MDYRFNMTPRLIAIAIIGFIALMALLFALGFQIGQQWGAEEATQRNAAAAQNQLRASTPVMASPTLAPVGAAIAPPPLNPTVTFGRPN